MRFLIQWQWKISQKNFWVGSTHRYPSYICPFLLEDWNSGNSSLACRSEQNCIARQGIEAATVIHLKECPFPWTWHKNNWSKNQRCLTLLTVLMELIKTDRSRFVVLPITSRWLPAKSNHVILVILIGDEHFSLLAWCRWCRSNSNLVPLFIW